jgi:hypothetical protein
MVDMLEGFGLDCIEERKGENGTKAIRELMRRYKTNPLYHRRCMA